MDFRGLEKGAEEFEEARRRKDRSRSELIHEQEAVPLTTANRSAAIADTTPTAREESRVEMVEKRTRFVPDEG